MEDYTNEPREPEFDGEISNLRVMPFSDEAEQSVIAGMLYNRELIPEVMSAVNGEDFYNERNRQIFDTIIEMFNMGSVIDVVSLKDALVKKGILDSVGGMNYIFRMLDFIPSADAASVRHYSKIVNEKASIRRLINLCESTATRCYGGEGDFDDMIAAAEQGILNITRGKNVKGLTHISAFLNESIEKIEQLADAKETVTGLTTGFVDLDRRTAGLHPAELILIAGRPGMGKSALGLNIAQNAAIKDNASVAIFSLEMPGIQIANRMLSGQAKVSSERIKRGDLKDDDWPKLGEALSALVDTKIYIDDNSAITVGEIAAKCRKLKMEKGLDLVVIDYLQLMTSGARAGNRQEEVSNISRTLKVLANDLGIPVIALSQLNRSVEKRESKEPVLSDLRESGSIEQDADIVIFLYREGYYDENCEEPNKTKIKFEKHRNGEVGYEYLSWLGEYVKFANWSGMRE